MAVQPYQFEPLDRETAVVSVVVIVIVPGSAESVEEFSRPSVKSSKQIIGRCENSSIWKHYVVRTVFLVVISRC